MLFFCGIAVNEKRRRPQEKKRSMSKNGLRTFDLTDNNQISALNYLAPNFGR